MQGFNMGKYVPPDLEGTISGNALHSKKALGNRANKSAQGILTVRFEMPYPIWCTSCPKPTIIGQGVRFNAEKKKVGSYYSTPIFSFRMKHTACGAWIEIRTDPKNTAYVVVEGARKRDTGDTERAGEGGVPILTEEEREERRNNAFALLEGKVDDKRRLEASKERLEELQALQEQQWEDPYERNQKLRRAFRAERRLREMSAAVAGALQDKMSLGIELLPEHEDDVRRARLVEFGAVDPDKAVARVISKPLFATTEDAASVQPELAPSKPSRKLKAVKAAERHRANLAAEIRGNTRAKLDPFLMDSGAIKQKLQSQMPAGIIKKKREASPPLHEEVQDPGGGQAPTIGLVDYNSD
jgi:coiled-coil domain-containing protein 130